jgi:hypothetical protein
MELPGFLKLENDSLIFTLENKELIFYVPEEFFNDSKSPIAEIYGEDVSMIGICNWAIMNSDGSVTEVRPFTFPSMMLCSPNRIEKVKDFKIPGARVSGNYRLLHFQKGDKVIKQTRVPQLVDNAEMFFKIVMITAKFPTTISYDKIWELFIYNAELNGFNYNLHSQLFGIMTSAIARSSKDPSIPYRLSGSKDLHDYQTISIKMIPKFLSPFTSIVSENFDEALVSAILLSEKPDEELPDSPLEKVVTQ